MRECRRIQRDAADFEIDPDAGQFGIGPTDFSVTG